MSLAKLYDIPAAEAADRLKHNWDRLPDFPKDFQRDYKSNYLNHLRNQGDKYALEMADAIEKGEKIEEDPAGT